MTTAGASWSIVLRLGAAIVVASVLAVMALAAHRRVAFERALVSDDFILHDATSLDLSRRG